MSNNPKSNDIALPFKMGSVVEVHGLVKAATLNGFVGVVCRGPKGPEKRIAVQLFFRPKKLELRPGNVRPCAVDFSTWNLPAAQIKQSTSQHQQNTMASANVSAPTGGGGAAAEDLIAAVMSASAVTSSTQSTTIKAIPKADPESESESEPEPEEQAAIPAPENALDSATSNGNGAVGEFMGVIEPLTLSSSLEIGGGAPINNVVGLGANADANANSGIAALLPAPNERSLFDELAVQAVCGGPLNTKMLRAKVGAVLDEILQTLHRTTALCSFTRALDWRSYYCSFHCSWPHLSGCH